MPTAAAAVKFNDARDITNLRQVVASEVFRVLIGQTNSRKMAANRDEHRLDVLVKANQAIVRFDIAWLRSSTAVCVIHLKAHVLDGLFTCHGCISLLPAARTQAALLASWRPHPQNSQLHP